jgi:hypothetical protein
MEVHFTPDLQAKLSCLATQQSRNAETLVQEAVQRLVHYDAVRELIDTRYPG